MKFSIGDNEKVKLMNDLKAANHSFQKNIREINQTGNLCIPCMEAPIFLSGTPV